MEPKLLTYDPFAQTKNTSLILEGGGFRGIYTAGILDRFLEEGLHFPYTIGVSMGAIVGVNYIAKQPGRMVNWCAKYIQDKKYMSFNNLLKEGNFFSHDYGYNRAPRRFFPFDFKEYYSAPGKFYFTTTDVETGQPKYFEKLEEEVINLTLATSSLPVMSKFMEIQGRHYLDGGISDAIPIHKAEEENDKHVIILTRGKGYRKKAYKNNQLVERYYKNYPNLLRAFETRNTIYNNTLDYIDQLEKDGKAFVYRVNDDADTSMIQRDPNILWHNYNYGYSQADVRMNELKEFLKK